MADNEHVQHEVDFFTIAATAATVKMLPNNCPYPVRLVSVKFMPHAALTANDTNYRTLDVKKGAGGTTCITPKSTQTTASATRTGDMVAGTQVDLVLLTTGGGSTDLRRLAPGELHEFSLAHTASGVAISGSFIAVYEPVRGV